MSLTVVTGCMGSGKSQHIVDQWFEDGSQATLKLSCASDEIVSRSGAKLDAKRVWPQTILPIANIVIDEGQWLTLEQAEQLIAISESHMVAVCGLEKDFTNKPFPAMERLKEVADISTEFRVKCSLCDNIASTHIQTDFEGDVVEDKDEMFLSVCQECWNKYNSF